MNKTRLFATLCVLTGVIVLSFVILGQQAATAGAVPPPQLGTLMPLASPFATYIPPEVATQAPGVATQIPQPPPGGGGGGGGGQEQQATSTPLPTDTPEPTETPVPPPTATNTVAPLPTAKPSGGGPCPSSVALLGAAMAIVVAAAGGRRR